MLSPETFFDTLRRKGIDLFAGVPDSLLSGICACIEDRCPKSSHVITANEGNAIALAAGFHLSTGKTAAVYMQNSGLGNCINPLTSLTDPEVYRIPVLLIIGWRGEPSVKDEPQHVKQGRITEKQLNLLEIPYWILDGNTDMKKVVQQAVDSLNKNASPAAILVRKNTFSPYKSSQKTTMPSTLKREDALACILRLAKDDLIISTTGKTSREVYALRESFNQKQRDFLTVGSMGHTSSIALGVALGRPEKRVICLDGDGSLLMHMGAIPVIGSMKPENFIHVLLNNGAHESVGGQPTVANRVDFASLSLACGYKKYEKVCDIEGIQRAWQKLGREKGPLMLEVVIKTGSRADLGRPSTTPAENKQAFMQAAMEGAVHG
ncbi:phosphonopyruvate decarboxylase [Desulfobotulus alkaliphilus]|uniref:Phosphonopyruvate decarboxylase n=1 Tax=Desulfobotulus alkaliphilus TaxID=622671 RepID=A0A562RTD1_9BACT|nr:phosphonopyruvate decarboxylase [Desulfobotulus alkaliphilus]TWI72365.1 phosphonopyruvate decarboxylase [Desulfobotulus alkaliphilus]